MNDISELSSHEIEGINGGMVPLLLLYFGAAFALGLTATVAAGAGEIAENGK